MRGLLITLLVLVVLAVGADFGLRYLATQQVASEIQNELQLATAPDVDVAGFPFLTQAFRGEYEMISAELPPQRLGDVDNVSATVRLRTARIPFQDAIQGNLQALAAERAEATVTIPTASITAAAGVPGLQISQNGNALRLSAPVTVLGQQFDVSADLDVGVGSDGIQLRSGELTVAGATVPAEVLAAVGQLVALTVPLDGLPFTVEHGDVRVVDADLVVDATVRDVKFGAL